MSLALHPDHNFYPQFHNNPAIRALADKNKWTISDNSARPINIAHLRATKDAEHIYGASQHHLAEQALTLAEVNEFIPNSANATFFADSLSDGYLILDIEKTAPIELSRTFLSYKELVYAETSKSGYGIHAIYTLSDELKDALKYVTTTALRSPGGVFEFLIHHWVTFTRKVLSRKDYYELGHSDLGGLNRGRIGNVITDTVADELAALDTTTLTTLVLSLINFHDHAQYNARTTTADIDYEHLSHLEKYAEITESLRRVHLDSLADYDYDHSRFEWASLQILVRHLDAQLLIHNLRDQYSSEDRAAIVYLILTELIEHREKHDTRRSGMPLLLYGACRAVDAYDI